MWIMCWLYLVGCWGTLGRSCILAVQHAGRISGGGGGKDNPGVVIGLRVSVNVAETTSTSSCGWSGSPRASGRTRCKRRITLLNGASMPLMEERKYPAHITCIHGLHLHTAYTQ